MPSSTSSQSMAGGYDRRKKKILGHRKTTTRVLLQRSVSHARLLDTRSTAKSHTDDKTNCKNTFRIRHRLQRIMPAGIGQREVSD
jgi:hypothetical protein